MDRSRSFRTAALAIALLAGLTAPGVDLGHGAAHRRLLHERHHHEAALTAATGQVAVSVDDLGDHGHPTLLGLVPARLESPVIPMALIAIHGLPLIEEPVGPSTREYPQTRFTSNTGPPPRPRSPPSS